MFGSKSSCAWTVVMHVGCLALFACSDSGDNGNGTTTGQATDTTAQCGNGRVEGNELCDYSNQPPQHFIKDGYSCMTETQGAMPDGELGCAGGCMSFNTMGCYKAQPSPCGNGVIDAGEDCDRNGMVPVFNAGMGTCAEVTMGQLTVGALGCSAMCQFDMTRCVPGSGGNNVGGMGGGGMGGGGMGGGAGTGGGQAAGQTQGGTGGA